MLHFKPNLTWRNFLSTAPYFNSSLFDNVDYEQAPSLAPIPKAAFYYGLFDGEVSNGGVMQYFFNLAFLLPDFEKAPEFVAEHPVLKEALPFLEKVHDTWQAKRDLVYKAQLQAKETVAWPEELFSDTSFEDLENEFYAINHQLMIKLDHHILQNPDLYFNLKLPPGVTGKGTEHSEHQGAEMRFVDGFPEGPNLIKIKKNMAMVWITQNRNRLDYRTMDFFGENPIYGWIDYPTLRTHQVDYKSSHISNIENKIANWINHGSKESFDKNGKSKSLRFYCQGE